MSILSRTSPTPSVATLPYGCWPSSITAEMVGRGARLFTQVEIDASGLYWNEQRPDEGSQVIVHCRWSGTIEDVSPAGMSVWSGVHDYGGGAYALGPDETLFVVDRDDQRIHRIADGTATALTAAPAEPWSVRHGDLVVHPGGRWLACVREDHTDAEVRNTLVGMSVDAKRGWTLVDGPDFVAAPRFSPDGTRLCWLAWSQPNMPWDGTELWVGEVVDRRVEGAVRIAGGATESISQPRWSPDGRLHWVSDRTGYWNLYREDDATAPLLERRAEFASPDWMLGQSMYAFDDDGSIVLAWWEDAVAGFGILRDGELEVIDVGMTSIASVKVYAGWVACVGASPRREASVVVLDAAAGREHVVRRGQPKSFDDADLSTPTAFTFPTVDGATGHAFHYPPRNKLCVGPPGDRPPLVVMVHSGPTTSAAPALSVSEEAGDPQGIAIQFWTNRGFAVADVNYGGSTGYGRAYRERLRGAWGVVDVDDSVAAANHLAALDLVDGRRMIIRGGSAGGYTALCALTFRDAFAAGAVYFGVGDLETLRHATHKFEARYLDGLVGPLPERQDRHRERSPLHAADRIRVPTIVFHGRDDPVVPLEQADRLVAALRDGGVRHDYIVFDGESHGFRRADSIVRSLEAELAFYREVLGLDDAGAGQ